MAKLSTTNPAQTRYIVIVTVELQRVRWVEPIQRSPQWWPVPWSIRRGRRGA